MLALLPLTVVNQNVSLNVGSFFCIFLPSILLANVQSLENKMDDLRARISFQRDIRDCNILCLTETWLTPTVPDTAVTPSDNFSVLRMDRTAEAGKTKGGGVCFFINKKWCGPRNISILSRSFLPHLEHLSIICCPFYLPREFSSIVVTAVYIPPQADTSLALSKLHDELSGYINKHPDAAYIIAGDFNKANLKKVMPNFHQHISCPTRGLNTLDHCYTQFKNAYKAHSLPAFGKSDHAAIFLTPDYKQKIVHEPPVEREVTRWSSHSEATLRISGFATVRTLLLLLCALLPIFVLFSDLSKIFTSADQHSAQTTHFLEKRTLCLPLPAVYIPETDKYSCLHSNR